MTRYAIFHVAICCLIAAASWAQDIKKDDDWYDGTETDSLPAKVLHAEPLYIDLIRDLGARKGEKEWNVGFGIHDKLKFDEYEFLVEYEFAVMDRLGLEIEVPFTFIAPTTRNEAELEEGSRMESLKLAAQYTFMVSEKTQTSLAMGYINELEFSDFKRFGYPWITGNIYNPFLVAAQRIGRDFHSLIYTGPQFHQPFSGEPTTMVYEAHTNIHYMIRNSRNFIGIEANKYFSENGFDMTLRPQMRVGIADNLLIGIVTGIPVNRTNQGLSMFLRMIWEPGRH